MTTNLTNPSVLSKNLLINPSFSVIQGAASGTIANSLALPTASLGYPSGSNWCFAASGSSAVAYAIDPASEKVTFTGAASTTAIYLLQRIESKDIVTLANRLATVTLSAEISNSLLTSVIWEVFRPTTSDDVHGTIASPTQTLIASGTWTVNNTLTRYSTSFTLPAFAAKGLEIRLRVGAQTSGTWIVARLQLEEGWVATNFNCSDYPNELRRCQRYFERMDFVDGQTIGAGSTIITFNPPLASGVRFDFKETKRSAPIAATSAASSFLVASTVGSSISATADTGGVNLDVQASSGNTGSNWTCVPLGAFSSAFLAASSYIP